MVLPRLSGGLNGAARKLSVWISIWNGGKCEMLREGNDANL